MDYSKTSIGVAIRIRPLLPDEALKGHTNSYIEADSSSQSIIVSNIQQNINKRYKFDTTLEETASQEEVFNELKIETLVKKVVEGFNATIFAYGQTGSGKTFTMEGYEYDSRLRPIIKDNENIGLAPRSIKALFNELQNKKSTDFTVYCTYIQLYKENIYDLLNPAHTKAGLKLRWNKHEEFYVENVFMHPCHTAQEVLTYYHQGLKNKIMASHNVNAASSRSHSILSLIVEAVNNKVGKITTSRMQLVDLAGSEKTSLTGNEGMALKESIEINKALFTLRQVISALSTARIGEPSFVPYRDSKLTSLLKQSIGGNSYCVMIACIAPIDDYFDENVSTLLYATKAGNIANEPIKNLDPKTKVIKELKKELKKAKEELSQANKHIVILTELITLDKAQQISKLKEYEKQPLRKSQIKKIQDLRSTLENFGPDKRSTSPEKFPKVAFNENSAQNTEEIGEKLYDSVKMIRDLMEHNKKLKAALRDQTSARKNKEAEVLQLQYENRELIMKIENLENLLKEGGRTNRNLIEMQHAKEDLEKRVIQMEIEREEEKPKRKWASKRVIRDENYVKTVNFEKPASTSPSRNRETKSQMRESEYKMPAIQNKTLQNFDLRPISQDRPIENMSKLDAIKALSMMLRGRAEAAKKFG
ncbi:unnamed protein product [Blepharisma stoltei]|uniref:Kinesin-like protein n=1 Tax=Blepharisma stoltei TaxID=1481888 RepID=A0AAU9J541_9CILI|nr:unnamed protein product [Blepharisma stoltei]